MSNERVISSKPLISPAVLQQEIPCTSNMASFVKHSRQAVSQIMSGQDPRILVVVGPCSIHDTKAALEYAHQLAVARQMLGDKLEIVMRIYFEKPRTSLGWKGLIHDPNLDQSYDVNLGIRTARQLLLDINELGVPAATEFLDTSVPQFLSDLITWGAIGARTSESQIHRQLASALPMPIGFKNGTDGNIHIAVNAVRAAKQQQRFIGIDDHGVPAIFTTTGNPDCHIILRGGINKINYDSENVAAAVNQLQSQHLTPTIMIDCSHGNCKNNYLEQINALDNILQQFHDGQQFITGVMLESHLVAGKQTFAPGKKLTYGQSITDPCLSWKQTWPLLQKLAEASSKKITKKNTMEA